MPHTSPDRSVEGNENERVVIQRSPAIDWGEGSFDPVCIFRPHSQVPGTLLAFFSRWICSFTAFFLRVFFCPWPMSRGVHVCHLVMFVSRSQASILAGLCTRSSPTLSESKRLQAQHPATFAFDTRVDAAAGRVGRKDSK